MTQVNKERMLAEFKEIVALPCHSLQERPVFELLKGKLEALGFTVEEDDAGDAGHHDIHHDAQRDAGEHRFDGACVGVAGGDLAALTGCKELHRQFVHMLEVA